jgi:hypothetical protein
MRRFVGRVPGTEDLLHEHLTYFGGMLPHLLMADLSRWFVAAVAAGDDGAVGAFLTAVERLYTSEDPDARNVAEVSFMELLAVDPDQGERAAVEAIRRLAGPATARDLRGFEERFHNRGTTDR